MGLLSMAICKSVGLLAPSVKDSFYLDPVEFQNLKTPFTLLKSDILEGFLHADHDDDFVRVSLWGRTRGGEEWCLLRSKMTPFCVCVCFFFKK
jgi:hypothetical protein